MKIRTVLITGIILIVLLPLLLLLSGTVYYVTEMESVVVTRFGEVQYAVVTGFDPREGTEDPQVKYMTGPEKSSEQPIKTGAGLRLKWPFVERVHRFDSRLLTWKGDTTQISTMDLRTLNIDTAGFWRILDPIKFYERFSNRREAISLIGGVINSKIEDILSRTRLIEAVRNENLELEERVRKRLEKAEDTEGNDEDDIEEVEAAKIRYGRKKLIEKIMDGLVEKLEKRFGVRLIDIMFTRLNYTQSVRQNVYDRMISERQRIAERYRARGRRTKLEIEGKVSRQKDEMLSKADREVKNILGEAERDRIQIHAGAFSKAPKFFHFYRSLEVYRESLGKNTTLLLSNENRLLRFVTEDRLESLPESNPSGKDQNGN